jgi:hypothetical protein
MDLSAYLSITCAYKMVIFLAFIVFFGYDSVIVRELKV